MQQKLRDPLSPTHKGQSEFCAVSSIGFAQDDPHVIADGFGFKAKCAGYFLVGIAFSQKLADFLFCLGEYLPFVILNIQRR